MKCQIPQISWHSRDPVLSVDFQSYQNDFYRLASGGTDSHVLIWFLTFNENKTINIECASDLYRHQKSVNVVRFSPSGEILASGDDEGAIFLWKLKDRDQLELPNDEDNTNKEDWYPLKLLRGHLEDVYDISWSKDGNFLVSASMDNTAIMWDAQLLQKIHIFSDFKGYVQGIAWDPLNQYIASLGSDRALRIHNVNSKKLTFKVQKAPWTVSTDKGSNKARLFYDDTLQSYCRRLTFTPDGELLFAPSGIYEKDEMRKFRNATYVFSRHCLNKPALHLPSGDKYTVAVRCNPLLFELRSTKDVDDNDKENEPKLKSKPMIDLPYRMIIAVATCDSLLMYDTQQLLPFAFISNIHYTHLTDLSWSADGRILVASSTDGYCSFVVFNEEELGKVYVPKTPPKKETKVQPVNETIKDVDIKNEVLVKTPNAVEKSNGLNSFAKVEAKGTADEKNVKNSKSKSEKVIKSSPTTTTKLATAKIVKEATENFSSPKTVKKNENVRSIKSFFTPPTQKLELKKKSHDEVDDDVIIIENLCEKLEKPTVPHIAVTSPNTPAGTDKNVQLKSVDVHNSPIKLDITCEEAMDCETAYKASSSNSSQDSSKPKCNNQHESPIPDVEEAMDVSDNCKDALVAESSSKSSSKCNVKLDFGSLAKGKESDKDLESVDQEFSKPKSEISSGTNADNVPKTAEEASSVPNADDWKLELTCDGDTQADEIAASSTSNVGKSPEAKINDVTDKKVTPKRRVQFVTLSSKSTLK